jgi:hypothetical protein
MMRDDDEKKDGDGGRMKLFQNSLMYAKWASCVTIHVIIIRRVKG